MTKDSNPWGRPKVPRPPGTGASSIGEDPPKSSVGGFSVTPPKPRARPVRDPVRSRPALTDRSVPSGILSRAGGAKFGLGSRVRSIGGWKPATLVVPIIGVVAAFALVFATSSSTDSGQGVEPVSPLDTESATSTLAGVVPTDDQLAKWESIARSVVYVEATGTSCGWSGSGTIVGDGSYVLTNQHVSGDGECQLSVGLTESASLSPTRFLAAEIVSADGDMDLAIIRMFQEDGRPFVDASRRPIPLSASAPRLGDKLTLLGYPGLGGNTITLTSGDYSGVDSSEQYEYLKTTANMNPGVSGGAALDSSGQLVGIPTAGRGAEIACEGDADCVANGSTIGLLRPVKYAAQLIAAAIK